ncbi:MAG: cytidine deaminase [Bacillota bacterium]
MDNEMIDKLKEKSLEARENAYVPYSEFPVGAAVLTEDGTIYTGCNIENASYSLTNCAERTAIFKAVSEGDKNIIGMVVIGDTPEPISPCGPCRQVMNEFNPDMEVHLFNLKDETEYLTAAELLPGFFNSGDMQ